MMYEVAAGRHDDCTKGVGSKKVHARLRGTMSHDDAAPTAFGRQMAVDTYWTTSSGPVRLGKMRNASACT